MSSTTTKNDAFQNSIEETEEEQIDHRSNSSRPSLVPRQISFAQDGATFGEIILVLLPYFVLIFDVFIYFLLRGFKFTSFDNSILRSNK
ncbi:unnamed protein product [Adineta steineri]|uniref:Uncharacterized protein n=1 Tax=Adineta steineri TaxID=433720 RepID=A0A819EEZ2_9BILA|nr:unnamed protein product [Adineta steineri]CAF1496347.1 unnamed protein product [Adineta steineri]CAF3684970.1 unnamed protein product [Adineta steineri]CAF3849039.1 unnamed protein product [Adineta steineri]